MKKIIVFLLFIIIPFKISASSIVMDADSGEVLYSSSIHKKQLIASTTKILTAMVVINNCNLDEVITIDNDVLKSYGSSIYIEPGEKISIRDLLYGLMLRSGNDAAYVLAKHVGGSMEGFSIYMNELASSIGMKDSKFFNSSGLDEKEENISTAYDMALLMKYAMNNEEFKRITSTKEYTVKTNKKTYIWYNKNKLLSMYKYTTGGKTGYTKKAHRTLVTSASKNNHNLIIVTLNESDDFNFHKNMYEIYFNKFNDNKKVSFFSKMREYFTFFYFFLI